MKMFRKPFFLVFQIKVGNREFFLAVHRSHPSIYTWLNLGIEMFAVKLLLLLCELLPPLVVFGGSGVVVLLQGWCCWQFDVFATEVKRLLPCAHETVSEKFALLLCHALLLPAPQEDREREVKLKMFS